MTGNCKAIFKTTVCFTSVLRKYLTTHSSDITPTPGLVSNVVHFYIYNEQDVSNANLTTGSQIKVLKVGTCLPESTVLSSAQELGSCEDRAFPRMSSIQRSNRSIDKDVHYGVHQKGQNMRAIHK
ncbi:hypothetical protein X801_03811 [Opisthorchis viverrini]|nr:hypothetical protein X801_03811 [Opisthorchis viverrini]